MKKVFCFLLSMIIINVFAQVGGTDLIPLSNGSEKIPIFRGEKYLSIKLIKTKVYIEKKNWWIALISGYDQVSVLATINIDFKGHKIEDKRISKPIFIEDDDVPFDIPRSLILLNNFPNDCKKIALNVAVHKILDDDFEEIIELAAEATEATSGLTMPAIALNTIPVAKKILDFIYKKKALEKMVDFNGAYDIGSSKLQPGIYVAFSAKSSNDYKKYLNNISEVKWANYTLKYDNEEITDANYIVVEVSYKDRLYEKSDSNRVITARDTAWGKEYIEAYELAKKIQIKSKEEDIRAIKEKLLVASTFLICDQDLTYTEKKSIDDENWEYIESLMNSRISRLKHAKKTRKIPQVKPEETGDISSTSNDLGEDFSDVILLKKSDELLQKLDNNLKKNLLHNLEKFKENKPETNFIPGKLTP